IIMNKIILSNFLESKGNYEIFKDKIKTLNLNDTFDSFLFDSALNKPEKINHIVHEIFEIDSNFKDIIEFLDYSHTEKQMLIFCFKSADRYDLMKILKVDLLADITNH